MFICPDSPRQNDVCERISAVPQLYALHLRRLCHLYRGFLVAIGVILGSSTQVRAQLDYLPQVGIKEFAVYQHTDIDDVDLTTGNVNLHIPLISFPQKGNKLRLNFIVRYNEPQWNASFGPPVQAADGYHATGAWGVTTSGDQRVLGVDVVRDQGVKGVYTLTQRLAPGCCGFGDPVPYSSSVSGIRDRSGATHLMETSFADKDVKFPAPDGSGWRNVPTSDPNVFAVRDKDGLTYMPFHPAGAPGNLSSWNISDPHGNIITVAADGWNDSVGRHIPGSWSGQGVGFPNAPNGYPSVEDDPIPGVPSDETGRCSNGAIATRTWVVPASADSGGSQTYYFCYSQYSANTHFNVVGVPIWQLNWATISEAKFSAILLSKILLPNGTSYSFQYDPDFLDLTRIDLPNGGVITYDWSVKKWDQCSTALPVKRVVIQRTMTAGGGAPTSIWKYNWDPGGVCLPEPGDSIGVIITNPDGNEEWHHQVSSTSTSLVRDVDYFRGSTSGDFNNVTGIILKKVETTAPYKESPLFMSTRDAVVTDSSGQLTWLSGYSKHEMFPGPVQKVVTTLYDPQTHQIQSSQETDYASLPSAGSIDRWNPDYYYYSENGHDICACINYSEIETTKIYDVVQGSISSPGPLLRRTETTYKFQDPSGQSYADAGMTSLPSSVTVYDGSNAQQSQTTYSYDESSYSAGAVAGDLTTTSKWISGTLWSTTHTRFNSEGVWAGSVDSNGNTINVTAYDCSGRSIATAKLAAGSPMEETVSYAHDCNTGKLTSYTDANGKTTSFNYADPLGRIRSVNYPDGGHTGINYTDYTGGTNTSVNLLTDLGGTAGQLSQTIFYDLLGRTVRVQKTAPEGTITVDSTYDAMGRVHSTSNPYTSTTSGTTISQFDELGRPDRKTNPDGSFQRWSYNGNVTAFTDERGNIWNRTVDALNRLTQVVEPSGATTTYTYDALGNLKLVTQPGVGTETARATRHFDYDGLSRLTSAVNPESGHIGYTYFLDNTTTPCSGDPTLPCSKTDARNVTTHYSYDALNRLIGKKYSGGTYPSPTSCYAYDSAFGAGSNTIGRLTGEWTQLGDCPVVPQAVPASAISWKQSISYDAMGRLKDEVQCSIAPCGAGSSMHYTYNLVGNVTSSSNGFGTISLQSNYDSLGRLQSVAGNSVWSGPQFPLQLFNATHYSPAGIVDWTMGGSSSSDPALTLHKEYDSRFRVTQESVQGHP